jgi:predicted lipoprotein with Yx(FWY)xxD motif
MKRTLIPLLLISMLAFAGVASAAAKHGTTIKLGKTSKGKILTTNGGFTIYEFGRDGKNKDRCVGISGCKGTWPPVTTKAKPVAGSGLKSKLLGTIKLSDGSRQVTYNGHPLYTYISDSGPRQTDYIGVSMFGGTWLALNANGNTVK